MTRTINPEPGRGGREEKLVTCESVAAITLHVRDTTQVPISYSGFAKRPQALCGAEVAWDTRIPVSNTRCRECLAVLTKQPHRSPMGGGG
jgi:hypothetical protein